MQVVPGPADALQAAGDRLRALDLDHEVDCAHVDSELERRRGHETRDLTALQQLLDLDPLLARQRAVVGSCELALGELVQTQGEALGQAPVVDEDDRRAVRLDELEQGRIDRRPDRAARDLDPGPISTPSASTGTDSEAVLCSSRMSSTGTTTSRSSSLRVPASTRVISRPVPATKRPISRAAAASRKTDALERLGVRALEPLEREREVRAALRAGDGMHLVEDQRLDPAEHLATLRGQQQNNDSGVVIRMSGGFRSICCRSRCGVSPVRTATLSDEPSPASGPRRLRSMS